ncbi:N-acetyltransferase [Chitinophaga barathri]|uniref:N-acetyltransferase n=1 Tax=Chitinophaga barathri TaxID=1647451 RepID=A0A3N4N518_9BACT|nr:N-acetyltransferase [Chitinophaga barathri]
MPATTQQDAIIIRTAEAGDVQYAAAITAEMEASAKARGTGIARRSVASIIQKILQGKAVIALTVKGIWAGFSYLETWEQERFVSNSGLIVSPAFRERGIAAMIKQQIFQLSRVLYPAAKIFSITTGMAVMKLNTRLGFEPVTYDALTHDPEFWKGCGSCVNHGILCSKGGKNCLCTALLFDPAQQSKQ